MDKLNALFLGGTDAFKLGEAAHALVVQALELGKHVHMGRVNGGRRLQLRGIVGASARSTVQARLSFSGR